MGGTRRILIVDSGLKHAGGHNFSYTRAVQAALESRGFAVDALGNRNMSTDLVQTTGYRPIFSVGTYDYPPGGGRFRDLAYLYAQSVIFGEELWHGLRQVGAERYGLIFCHTVRDFELLGWRRCLSRLRPPGRVMMLMRDTPGWSRVGRWKRSWHPYFRIRPRSFNGMRRTLGARFTLLTDSEFLSEDYARVYRHRIATVPIPINDSILRASTGEPSTLGKRYPLAADGYVRIGYLGDDRGARGFDLLPQLVARASQESDVRVRFFIQCPNAASGRGDGRLSSAFQALAALASDTTKGRVTLIPERLPDEEYAELLRHVDVVVIPYEGRGYREPTSGVFAEALAMGKPVVVTSGTWMAHELRRSGGGTEFADGDAADLAAKVVEVVKGYQGYARRAQDFSLEWRRFHSSHRLAELLLEESGLAREQPSVEPGVGTWARSETV
jgi:glycosyltransferase involved in cell wall biosynthesis